MLELPVVHLDTISKKYLKGGEYNGAWNMMNKEIQYIAENQPMWIIDGNFFGTKDYRLERADIIIYLDFSRYTCLLRLFLRRIKNFKQLYLIQNFPWHLLRTIYLSENNGLVVNVRQY